MAACPHRQAVAEGYGDRANPLEQGTDLVPRLSLPRRGRPRWLLLWELGLRQERRCRINPRVKKTGSRSSCTSPAQTKPLQEVFPWIGITAACQSHLKALNQQAQAGEGAGGQLLGVSPLCPADPRFPKPLRSWHTVLSQAAFRHSPASIRASQRSRGGDLWLTTAPACGQGVGSPQSPKSWIPARPINKHNSKPFLQAARADKICPACVRDSAHVTQQVAPSRFHPKTRGHPFSLPTGSY